VAERKGINQNERFEYSGRVHHTLNLGSYNYLGFSETDSKCNNEVIDTVGKFGTSTTSPQCDGGTTTLHRMVVRASVSP
jgi:serine palmitoyltransferase